MGWKAQYHEMIECASPKQKTPKVKNVLDIAYKRSNSNEKNGYY